MGEQPIFTTKAHVFHIDPATKKNWLPSSQGSVNVSFYYDSNRSTYRIISVDGSKAIINSTLVPNMAFTKTSQKFGQWSDARANTVYGLGFATETDLNNFAEKFGEVRELTKQQLAPPSYSTATNASLNKNNQNGGDTVDAVNVIHQPPIVAAPAPPPAVQNSEYMTPKVEMRQGTVALDQLKYENDRLKHALAQSSQNAKKWEVELQTLKNNNARLTTALQESAVNVEEWKVQLSNYKEANVTLKKKVIEFEQNEPSQQEEVNKMQKEMSGLMEKLSVTEAEKKNTQHELATLRSKVAQELTRTNTELEGKLNTLVNELDRTRSSQSADKTEMVRVHDIISRNVSELVNAQNQLAKLLPS
ncbi:homer protein homolog 2-like isoform X2 [Watersipora subatra]|uniref:homer protein homolog 2-like isoform X2 n=1 Tax=Watersipora subatra TaxID=2589382 RepID=UPI00355B3633